MRILTGVDVQDSVVREIRTGQRGELRTWLFEAAAGLAYLFSGIGYLLNENEAAVHSIIGQRVYPLDIVWSAGMIAGGVAALFGSVRPALRWRVAGLILLGAALAMQTVAAVLTRPDLREAFNAIFAVACVLRGWLIVRIFHALRDAGVQARG